MAMSTITGNKSDSSSPWLSDLPATAFQTWSAVAVAAVVLVAFMLIAPFAGVPLGALNIFFPLLDAIVFVTDLVTAVLLFSQFSISGSRPLLALANGYLFNALSTVARPPCRPLPKPPILPVYDAIREPLTDEVYA
jgi:hypothetical protein